MDGMNNLSENGNWASYKSQRRNFFLITVFMFVLAFTNSSIQEINFLGNKIASSNAVNIKYLLWLTFFYFMLRYLYSFKAISDPSMKECYENLVMEYYGRIAYKKDAKNSNLEEIVDAKLDIAPEESRSDYKIYTQFHHAEKDSTVGHVLHIRVVWSVLSQRIDGGYIEALKQETVFTSVNINEIKWGKIWSKFKLMSLNYYFTEYYLPLVFAYVTIVLSVYLDRFIF